MSKNGVDVSIYQGSIDWKRVRAAGTEFAFMKATEGTSLVDEKFTANWDATKAAGVRRGAYHFFRPATDPGAQATFFCKIVDVKAGELPPVLDLEVTGGLGPQQLRDAARAWLTSVEAKTGVKPLLYTTPAYWAEKMGGMSDLAEYPLWIANWGTSEPSIPGGWTQWTYWQYSAYGRVDGIGGDVDLNRFNDGTSDPSKAGERTLHEGSVGPDVRTLQRALLNAGENPGGLDGVFGAQTLQAVLDFQQGHGLGPDGIVGPQTRAALGM